MKSRQFRIRPDQEAACVELHPDVPAADAVRLVLQRGIHAERRSLVEPFPAPQSHQERPEHADVSAHGWGRQDAAAGLSLAERGTE